MDYSCIYDCWLFFTLQGLLCLYWIFPDVQRSLVCLFLGGFVLRWLLNTHIYPLFIKVRKVLGSSFRIIRRLPSIFLACYHSNRCMHGQSTHCHTFEFYWRFSQNDKNQVFILLVHNTPCHALTQPWGQVRWDSPAGSQHPSSYSIWDGQSPSSSRLWLFFI